MAERSTGRPAQAALTEQARRGVRAWVRHAGRRTGAGLCRVLATARPAEGLPVPDECR